MRGARPSLLVLPLAAMLLAHHLVPVDGQQAPAVEDSLDAAIERTTSRVIESFTPHLVRIRPDVPGLDGLRRSRTGVVVRPGVVVTCAGNVEAFGVDDLVVETLDGRTFPAVPRGRDLRLRLVVLAAPDLDAPPAPRAPDDALPGALVLALGTPLGEGMPTATSGILSARGRFGGRADQYDAGLDASNFGGAIVDLEGRLMGIPVQVDERLGSRSGVGFAIPLARLDPVLDRLLAGEELQAGRIGVSIARVDWDQSGAGVRVQGVLPNAPAAAAGLEQDDVIVSLAGRPTPDVRALREVIADLWAGQQVEVELLRGEQPRTVVLTVAPR
jgi:S1-C subfamily serine protease